MEYDDRKKKHIFRSERRVTLLFSRDVELIETEALENTVNFSFKGRYQTLGDAMNARAVWFVLHGYGQLAEYFIKKFTTLIDLNVYVIAPEALSRFYLEDMDKRMRSGNNRVGATWMTRENRETDIENYLRFLNAVYDTETIAPDRPVTVLGFSQGAATASRWVTASDRHFNRLILWSGIFPPDLHIPRSQEVFKSVETISVYGEKDPFLNDARFSEMNDISKRLGIEVKSITFDGGHDIHADTLKALS